MFPESDSESSWFGEIKPPFLFKVYFDGGGAHDFSYGSFEIEFNGFRVERHRMPFRAYNVDGMKITSNVAEYLSLIAALKWMDKIKDKAQYAIRIYGDSELVVNQVRGSYRCKQKHLEVLRDACRRHLNQFGEWSIVWHSRSNSVARFGH